MGTCLGYFLLLSRCVLTNPIKTLPMNHFRKLQEVQFKNIILCWLKISANHSAVRRVFIRLTLAGLTSSNISDCGLYPRAQTPCLGRCRKGVEFVANYYIKTFWAFPTLELFSRIRMIKHLSDQSSNKFGYQSS